MVAKIAIVAHWAAKQEKAFGLWEAAKGTGLTVHKELRCLAEQGLLERKRSMWGTWRYSVRERAKLASYPERGRVRAHTGSAPKLNCTSARTSQIFGRISTEPSLDESHHHTMLRFFYLNPEPIGPGKLSDVLKLNRNSVGSLLTMRFGGVARSVNGKWSLTPEGRSFVRRSLADPVAMDALVKWPEGKAPVEVKAEKVVEQVEEKEKVDEKVEEKAVEVKAEKLSAPVSASVSTPAAVTAPEAAKKPVYTIELPVRWCYLLGLIRELHEAGTLCTTPAISAASKRKGDKIRLTRVERMLSDMTKRELIRVVTVQGRRTFVLNEAKVAMTSMPKAALEGTPEVAAEVAGEVTPSPEVTLAGVQAALMGLLKQLEESKSRFLKYRSEEDKYRRLAEAEMTVSDALRSKRTRIQLAMDTLAELLKEA